MRSAILESLARALELKGITVVAGATLAVASLFAGAAHAELKAGGAYLPLQDDIASVAFWYQTLPTAPFPQLPDRDYLEVI